MCRRISSLLLILAIFNFEGEKYQSVAAPIEPWLNTPTQLNISLATSKLQNQIDPTLNSGWIPNFGPYGDIPYDTNVTISQDTKIEKQPVRKKETELDSLSEAYYVPDPIRPSSPDPFLNSFSLDSNKQPAYPPHPSSFAISPALYNPIPPGEYFNHFPLTPPKIPHPHHSPLIIPNLLPPPHPPKPHFPGFHSVVNYGLIQLHHGDHYEPHHNGATKDTTHSNLEEKTNNETANENDQVTKVKPK